MSFDQQLFQRSFQFNEQTVADLRGQWLTLMELAVWGDLQLSKLGALPRLRKRILEVGENLHSLFASRDWIPQPREQIKSVLGTCLKIRDSLQSLERSAVLLSGGDDYAAFEAKLLAFRDQLVKLLEQHENQWAELLESQYQQE